MARAEGWSTKSGSKWKTMPELMLMYRAAAFLIRTYAPELSMGLPSEDELFDQSPAQAPERRGGIEAGHGHYPVVVALHVLFFLSLVAERHFLPKGWDPLWPFWLVILILSQLLRAWCILSLGRFWTTKIIVIPGERPVLKGPYRFIRHPNYVAVLVEILAIPILCGAYVTAGVFSILNALVLWWRIREEERALALLEGSDLRRLPRFIPRMGAKSRLRTGNNGECG